MQRRTGRRINQGELIPTISHHRTGAKRQRVARGRPLRRLRCELLEHRWMLAATNPLDLASLDGANGFRMDGVEAGDFSGVSVSAAGDINGDGFDDMIVGAYYAAVGGKNYAGETYVVFGKGTGFPANFSLGSLNGTNGFRLDGAAFDDYSGFSVRGAGDVNGDGFDDLILGAPRSDPGGNNYAGTSYVVFGKASGFSAALDLGTLDGANGFRLDGIDTGDDSGRSVGAAGDVNGDGLGDVIIGAPKADPGGRAEAGEAYVVFGKRGVFPASISLASLDGVSGFRMDGVDAGDDLGRAVKSAGDVNGDGFDDLVIGAPKADPDGKADAGETYVVFGKAGGFAASIDLAALSGTDGFRLNGIDASDESGRSVSGAGDVNGDNLDDLIIGAPGNISSPGEAYLVFGQRTLFSASIDLASVVRLDGVAAGDRTGRSVSGAGDVNADGFADVIVGALQSDPGGDVNAGTSYVVFGRAAFGAGLGLASLDGSNGFRLDGIDAGDYSGISASGAGDVNGDGFDDVIIGADGANSFAGESYVVFGGNFSGGAATQVGTPGANVMQANQGAGAGDILIGGASGDTLIGDGGPDLLIGGEGNDLLVVADANFRRVVGGNGSDTLRASGLSLDLTALDDNRITGIEAIDLRGGSPSTLTLNALEVLNLSDDFNQLIVRRDADDVVNRGAGWTRRADQVIGGGTFEVYTQGNATLKVQMTALTPGIRAASLTTDGATGLIVTYEIIGGSVAPFEFGFYRSANVGVDAADLLLRSVPISAAADLTEGIHTKTYGIGAGAGLVPLPGAGSTETGSSYFVLGKADRLNSVNETGSFGGEFDNIAILSGVYHAPGGPVMVHGTEGADSIRVLPGSVRVEVNAASYTYPAVGVSGVRIRGNGGDDRIDFTVGAGFGNSGTLPFVFLGGGGEDTARVRGSDSTTVKDLAVLRALQGRFTGPGYSLSIWSTQGITAYGQGGLDEARLYDSAADDALIAFPTHATLSDGLFTNRVENFRYVYAYADLAGADTAEFHGLDGTKDYFYGTKTYARMSDSTAAQLGTTYFARADLFEQVHAYGRADGGVASSVDLDEAVLYGPASADTLTAGPTLTNFSGDGFNHTVHTFRFVTAQGGSNDTANFHAASASDQFVQQATYAIMSNNNFRVRGNSFGTVNFFPAGSSPMISSLSATDAALAAMYVDGQDSGSTGKKMVSLV